MDLLAVANLAPAEMVAFLDGAINAGRLQAPQVPADLNTKYLAAIDAATVAAARVKIWAARRTSTAAVNRISIYAGLQQSKSIGRADASVSTPIDDYSDGVAQAFTALSEAGALLQRGAAAAESRSRLRSK